jgi:hypothetical protein
VTLNGTHGTAGFGGVVAAPVFRVVAQETLRLLDVPKDIPDAAQPPLQIAKNEDLNDLAVADADSKQGNILLDSDEEEAGSAGGLAAGPMPASPAPSPANGPRVPDFKGKTMRAVLAEATALGLPVIPDGSGRARAQYPAAGAVLHAGERVKVQFAR